MLLYQPLAAELEASGQYRHPLCKGVLSTAASPAVSERGVCVAPGFCWGKRRCSGPTVPLHCYVKPEQTRGLSSVPLFRSLTVPVRSACFWCACIVQRNLLKVKAEKVVLSAVSAVSLYS